MANANSKMKRLGGGNSSNSNLQDLLDERDILEVWRRCGLGMDNRDIEVTVSVFTEDATWITHFPDEPDRPPPLMAQTPFENIFFANLQQATVRALLLVTC